MALNDHSAWRAGRPLSPSVAWIPFWRRFHVRMSTLFGGVVFLVVTLMAIGTC
jgi:hypothetical protein